MIKRSNQKINFGDNSSGVSEAIGVILLISIVAIAVAIIAAGLFGQPLPQKIPDIRLIPKINSSGNNNLTIYHDGGDPLYKGEFYVKINGERRDDYTITPNGGNIWSEGTSLEFKPVPTGSTIQIFYYTGSGEVILDRMQVQPGQTIIPDIYVTPTPSPCQGGECNIANCSQTVIRDAYTQIVTSNSSVFLRTDEGTQLASGGYLKFKVTNEGSTLTRLANGNPVVTQLNKGDIVQITLTSTNSGNFKAFGLGDKFYFLGGEAVNILINNIPFADNPVYLQNGWITGYIDLGSTLTINSKGIKITPNKDPKYDTLLVINGTTIINDGKNTSTITISGIRPIGVGLFVVEENNNGKSGVNFVGYADHINFDQII